MNLTEILADCYRRLALPAAPAASETTRLTSFLNTTHRQLLGLPGFESLRDDTLNIQTLAPYGTFYGLPPNVTRIKAIWERTTPCDLRLTTFEEIRASGDEGMTATGVPDRYVIGGYEQVQNQPTHYFTPHVQSTSLTDTNVIVYAEGTNEFGATQKAQVTLNGQIPVPLPVQAQGLALYWYRFHKFYLSGVATGDVRLYEGLEGVDQGQYLLAQIPIGKTYSRYLMIHLYPAPTSNIIYWVEYVRDIPDMVQGTDEPLLPPDFHWLLVEGVLMKEWTKRDDDRRVAAEREYTKGLSALRYFVTCQAEELHVSGRRRLWEHSRFGAHYPAMRY